MYPTRKALWLLVVSGVGPLAVPFAGIPYMMGWLLPLAVVAVIISDRMLGTQLRFAVRRRVAKVLSVGAKNKVELVLKNLNAFALHLSFIDEAPQPGSVDEEQMSVHLSPGQQGKVVYWYTPKRRGRYTFGHIRLQTRSRLGFWFVQRSVADFAEVQVYPDIEAISQFELLAQTNSLSELGYLNTRVKGDGHEFERMRDYRSGDEPRKVDWKTTARLNRLIVREMGQDRNQNVLFMIDMGRLMQQTTDGLSHFDYALNTAIILGHIAQKKGDNIGAVLFSDKVKKYVPLRKGRGAVDALIMAAYDMEPEPVATNYSHAFKHVMANVNKRSLLLLMTHMGKGEEQRLIRTYASYLGRQHLPLCLFFKEPALERAVRNVPHSTKEAFEVAAAADLMMDRTESLSRLQHAKVLALDALPGQYSATAINNYLDIKARNLL
ncbi:MAG: DUF58 domain-containing protein [Deltaproteobacteria bacterium]|nr:DUF58 domain-containing protein [Deltaproteobacteria bacterium]MBN2671628.1 DUF58 domain-containing protein [Deltaproteobacteria bacterium]